MYQEEHHKRATRENWYLIDLEYKTNLELKAKI